MTQFSDLKRSESLKRPNHPFSSLDLRSVLPGRKGGRQEMKVIWTETEVILCCFITFSHLPTPLFAIVCVKKVVLCWVSEDLFYYVTEFIGYKIHNKKVTNVLYVRFCFLTAPIVHSRSSIQHCPNR